MRKKMSRFIAGILFACMVAGSIPAEAVYGADNVAGNAQESEQNQSGVEGYTNVTGEEKQPGGIEEIQDDAADNDQKAEEESSGEAEDFSIDNEETDVSENEIDIAASDEDSIVEETTGESEKTEKAEINFVYIESPYLETPGTQRIVFAFDQEITAAESVTLTVEDELGIREEWGLAQQTDHLYLFEKVYTGDSYTGTYHAVSLNFYGEQNESIILADAGIEAEFGVNEKYDGIEELQPVEDSAVEESGQRQVDASVVTIDENGVTQAQDSIADALNAVSAQTASENRISTFSADASSKTRSARSGDIVVALDPGHDANDAGAQGFGLREEDLTLKIANYCKAELEQYAGVSVYMTRTTAACPFNCTSAGSCIAQRAQAAAAAGAQIFVSFHLNASVSSSANGAEIIVPNYNWKYEVGAQGHALAEKILAELTALGLANRGIYSKDTTINERYPDGSLSDYFSVMIYNKENGIPGIIVEHAFLSNSGDVNRFLTTEEGLKQLGVADAAGIANYLGLSKGYWDGDYYYENGQKVYGEKLISGKWYYLNPDNNGAKQTGFFNHGSRTVYYAETGEMLYGEQQIDGKWYYFDTFNGRMQTGFFTHGTRVVYYAPSGEMLYGEQQIDGKWYYFDTFNGRMQTGLFSDGIYTYYYASSGERMYGEHQISGKWYYFDEKTGHMKTGFIQHGSRTVYYASSGEMLYGEQKINEKWYYFDTFNGRMQTGWYDLPTKTVYYAETGEMLYGDQQIDGEWYYFNEVTGALENSRTGWGEKDGQKVYYLQNGQMAIGEQQIGDKWYYFDESGYMQTGFVQHGSRTVYYAETGEMLYGEQEIDGKWYYFDTFNGRMQTGFFTHGTRVVYYASSGEMLYGEQEIDGKWYYFDTFNGRMQTGFFSDGGYTYYYSSSGEMIYGEHQINGNWYYFDEATGEMQTGFVQHGSRTVYYASSGEMLYGEQQIDGKWYYFDTFNGRMQTGFFTHGTRVVYYASSGEMLYGEQQIDGKWYYFDTFNGRMQTGLFSDGIYTYYYASSGERMYGEHQISGKWYYFDEKTGHMKTGFIQHGSRTVYYASSGEMLYGEQKINEKWYYFDTFNGRMQTGWYDLPTKTVYYAETGEMLYGDQQIDGEWYYFNEVTGALENSRTGWGEKDGQKVYYLQNGQMAIGEQQIGDKWYYFDESGYMQTGFVQHGSRTVYYAETGEMLYGWHQIQGMWYYFHTFNGAQKYQTKELYDIEGSASVTVDQMVQFYLKNSPIDYPSDALSKGGANTLKAFCQIYYDEANKEGIRVEVAFAQAMLETGWLKFGGDVSIDQYNFAGLGATGGGANGERFPNVQIGVRAQIQHLKAYASTKALNQVCVDTRFHYVTRGSAKYVEWLGIQENPNKLGWATSEQYGMSIVTLINKLKNTSNN